MEDVRIRLLIPADIPREGVEEKINILGTDVADLVTTIGHNLDLAGGAPFSQRKVCYESFSTVHLGEFSRVAADRCQSLLEELDLWPSEHDQGPEAAGADLPNGAVTLVTLPAAAPSVTPLPPP